MNYYFLPTLGRIVEESDLRAAYELTVGRSPDKELEAFSEWCDRLTSAPMRISRESDPYRLAAAGYVDMAAVLYRYQNPSKSIEAAKAKMEDGRKKPDLLQLAIDLDAIDKMCSWRPIAGSNEKVSEFNSILVAGKIDQLQKLQDWVSTVWNRINRIEFSYDAWRVMLVRDTLGNLILQNVEVQNNG